MRLPPDLRSGDKFTAWAYQLIREGLRELGSKLEARIEGRLPHGRFAGEPTVKMRVKNTTDSDMDIRDVVGLGDQISDETESHIKHVRVIGAETPVIEPPSDLNMSGSHVGRWGVVAQKILAGAIGWAHIAGICLVEIDIGDEEHQFAEITDGEAYLTSCAFGSARILWVDPDTASGDRDLCLIRWPVEVPLLYEATADEASDGTIMVKPLASDGDLIDDEMSVDTLAE